MGISRRDFIKGTLGGAATLAAGGLLAACGKTETPVATVTPVATPAPTPAAVEATPAPAPAINKGKLYTAYINEQDNSFRTSKKELKTLFSPITMGSLTINNRMVKSAAGSACYLKGLTDELYEYYVQLAKGGVELIYVESIAALEIPEEGGYSEEVKAFAKRLVDGCAEYGSSLGYQVSGFGMNENNMTIEEIKAKIARMVQIAVGMKELGFKAVELNSAGFNMPEHFLSRFHNTRTDEYGIGSLENRARFVTEWIEGVKAACGDELVVQILIDAIEENDNVANNPTLMTLDANVTDPHAKVNTVEEGVAFAKLFEAAGCDAMHLRIGPLGHHVAQFAGDLYFILNGIEGATGFGTQYDFDRHWQGLMIGNTSGAGMLLDVAAKYTKELTIPCGAVTYMDPTHAPDFFETALEEGKVDFFMMNRPLTVDNQYINKLKEGRLDEIAPCTRCLHCHIAGNEANAMEGYCRVNALTQRVMRENGPATYELQPAEMAKKVMVIGGGPAGMEAARIAALRGHDVTLYEKNSTLGGLLDFANAVKGPHENILDLKKYLIRQCELAGVNVMTSTEVDAKTIENEAPDAVILAAGGMRPMLTVAGDNKTPVISIDDFMFTDMGDKVIVYGSNAQAFDTALWLTVQGKHVTMVTPNPVEELDKQQSQHAKRMMTTALYALGFNAYPSASIKEVKDGMAVVTMVSGLDTTIKCDAIVDCSDMQPNTTLVDGLSGMEVYTIGDCAAPYNIAMAIRGGNDAGRSV